MREAVRTCLKILAAPSFNDIVDEVISPTPEQVESDRTLDGWLRSNTVSGEFPSGTCSMGLPNDLMAVVNQHGRIRGIDNLRVADTSIIPGVVRGTRPLSAIVVGERIADWIVEEERTTIPQRVRTSHDTVIDLTRRMVDVASGPEVLEEPPGPNQVNDAISEPSTVHSLAVDLEIYVRQAGNETFTDGMDSTFANRVHESIELHGSTAVNAWAEILSRTENAHETGEELLRQLGFNQDASSQHARLQVLINSLSHPDPRIRDAAGLGLSFLEDPSSLPELREARRKEPEGWLKDNLELVIQQLDPDTWRDS
jgi:hypothetical protein